PERRLEPLQRPVVEQVVRRQQRHRRALEREPRHRDHRDREVQREDDDEPQPERGAAPHCRLQIAARRLAQPISRTATSRRSTVHVTIAYARSVSPVMTLPWSRNRIWSGMMSVSVLITYAVA